MELHSLYCVELADDALAPRLPRGTRAFFRPAAHAEHESVVVVEHDGCRSVRFLRQGPTGLEAAAINPAYAPLRGFRGEGVMCMVQQSKI